MSNPYKKSMKKLINLFKAYKIVSSNSSCILTYSIVIEAMEEEMKTLAKKKSSK